MNQKGFVNIVNIIVIVVVLVVVAAGGYFLMRETFLPQHKSQTLPEDEVKTSPSAQSVTSVGDWIRQPRAIPRGAEDFVVDEDRIQVLSPQGGERLEAGKTYEIRWDFPIYRGNATATIFLDAIPPSPWIKYKDNNSVIVENIPARGGTYRWTVTQPSFNNYRIDIYSPEIGTEFRGFSKPFSIIGSDPLTIDTSLNPPLRTDNLEVDSPLGGQEVTNPIIVKGRARNIFFEGEFKVELRGYDYPLGDPRYAESSKVITSTFAHIVNTNCDWIKGSWCDFEATVNYPLSGTGVKGENMLYFYAGDAKDLSAPVFIAALRVVLK